MDIFVGNSKSENINMTNSDDKIKSLNILVCRVINQNTQGRSTKSD